MPKQAFLLLAVLVCLGLVPRPVAAQGRPDCTAIVHAMHRLAGHGAFKGDASDIASQLGTDSAWVEKCATAYGRRLKPAPRKHTEDDEDLSAPLEEKEYEEVAREEAGQQENKVQEDLRNGVYATKDRGIDPDSSAEWEPYITHEWEPFITHEWSPYLRDDDDPGFE